MVANTLQVQVTMSVRLSLAARQKPKWKQQQATNMSLHRENEVSRERETKYESPQGKRCQTRKEHIRVSTGNISKTTSARERKTNLDRVSVSGH